MIVKTKLLISLPILLALSACDNDFEGNKEGNSIGSISISGDTIVGSSLSANLVDTNGYDASAVTYSWMANDVVISGASSSSYTLVDADAATKITVSASYTDDDGYDEVAKSNPTSTVEFPAVNTEGTVAISGDAVVDGELKATITDPNGTGATPVTYTWMVDGSEIADSNASTYTLTSAELGSIITVSVVYTDNDGFDEMATSEGVGPVTDEVIVPPAVEITKVASITDSMTDDAGELRYKDSMLEQGKLTVSFNKTLDDGKDAYIGLYGSSTSTNNAVIDLRIQNGVFQIRNNEDAILSEVTYTLGEWHDVEMTWDSSSTTEVTTLTLTIDGEMYGPFLSATKEGPDLTTDGVSTVIFKLGDNGGVTDAAFLVDDFKLYSDMAGTTEVFSDDFEGYATGDSLDTDNSASPYNSSTAEAVVAEAERLVEEEPEEPAEPNFNVASITDTMTDDAGELRYKDSMLEQGKLTVSFNKSLDDGKDAYIGLYGSSTSTNNAVIDLRIQNGVFEIRNNEDAILSEVTYTLGEWHDVEMTWDSSSTTEVTTLTLTIDGEMYGPFLSATKEGPDLTTDGVSTVIFKIGDNGGVTDAAFLVDDFKLYSDMAGTTEVFSDDFEGYTVGDSLDTDNSESPYNSSTAEAVVADRL
jgi:hypothetical protein